MSETTFWVAMGAVTFGTSILSGVLGMAGGMLLLTVLLLRLDPLVAIPVHGIVQLVSNASRAWFLRAHVQASVLLPFALPLLPTAALGLLVLGSLSPAVGRMTIGAFVLVATWRSSGKGRSSSTERSSAAGGSDIRTNTSSNATRARRLLPLGGALVGFCSTVFGATGPLLAPFILALELSPQSTVGTLAACQVFQHATKVAVFGAAGFDFRVLPALGLSACAALGSAVGTRWLERVPRAVFARIVRVVLTLLAAQLLASGAWQLAR